MLDAAALLRYKRDPTIDPSAAKKICPSMPINFHFLYQEEPNDGNVPCILEFLVLASICLHQHLPNRHYLTFIVSIDYRQKH